MPADHRRRLDIPACAGLPLEDFTADDLPKAGALLVGFADLWQFARFRDLAVGEHGGHRGIAGL